MRKTIKLNQKNSFAFSVKQHNMVSLHVVSKGPNALQDYEGKPWTSYLHKDELHRLEIYLQCGFEVEEIY